MNLTREQALEIGVKAMQDIHFEYDSDDEIKVIYDEGKIYPNINIWLVGFLYGKEDYGKNVGANFIINDDLQKAVRVSYRNGSISLGYDEGNDKYFVEKQYP